MGDVRTRIGELKAQADAWFDTERVERANRGVDIVLDARYVGQNFELAIGLGNAEPLPDAEDIAAAVLRRARACLWLPQSGRPDRGRELPPDRSRQVAPAGRTAGEPRQSGAPEAGSRRKVWFEAEKAEDTPVYDRATLMPGDTIAGPTVIEQLDSTTLLFSRRPRHGRSLPQSSCRDFRMSIDPITLEIMSNGLKSIADETYIALMKSATRPTSRSVTTIRPRLSIRAGGSSCRRKTRSRFISAR